MPVNCVNKIEISSGVNYAVFSHRQTHIYQTEYKKCHDQIPCFIHWNYVDESELYGFGVVSQTLLLLLTHPLFIINFSEQAA